MTSLSWESKKHRIKSVDSKLLIEIPDSLASQDWIVGVIPTQDNEPETMVAGVASWKQGANGIEYIDSVENLIDNSIQLLDGKINLREFGLGDQSRQSTQAERRFFGLTTISNHATKKIDQEVNWTSMA